MPVYTFRCSNCENQIDVVQGVHDEPPRLCTNCKQLALYRVYKPVGVVFKGSGFYATDNRSASGAANGRVTGGQADDPGQESKPAETKSTSKSDAKSESKSTATKSEKS